jgi:hypothetical protein
MTHREGVWVAGYVSKSFDFPKKEILMAYVSNLKLISEWNFLKRKI